MNEQSHYLYRQYAADGTLLYIGVTIDPKSRLVAHRSASSWGKAIARVDTSTYVGWSGRQAALNDEAYAIASEGPKYNRTFSKARAANVARVRVVSGVRFGSRAKAAPDVQYIDGVKYIRADAIALTPSQIKPEFPQ